MRGSLFSARHLIAGVGLVGVLTGTQSLQAGLSNDLELYYNFDADSITSGGIFDQSGNERTGSPNLDNGGLSFSSDVAGVLAGGLSLDNAGTDWIESLYTGVAGGADRTVSFWVKRTGATSPNVLVEWGTNTAGNRYTITQEISTTQGGGPGTSVAGGIRNEVQTDYRSTPTGEPSIADGNWNHVAVVFDSSVATAGPKLDGAIIYVNGVALGSYADGGGTPDVDTLLSGGVTISGGSGNGANRFNTGQMDEVGIWSRALSSSEVAQLAGGATYNLIAGTNFDDTSKSASSQTMTGIDWSVDELVAANTSVTTVGSNNAGYFTTGFGETGFAPDQNIENEGPWTATFEITLDPGATGTLEAIAFDYAALTNAGATQGTNFRAQNFDILVNGVVFDQQLQTTAVNGHLEFEDTALLASGLNTIVITSSEVNGPGYNMGIDNLRFFGDVVPEPSSLALLGFGGLLIARRRR